MGLLNVYTNGESESDIIEKKESKKNPGNKRNDQTTVCK